MPDPVAPAAPAAPAPGKVIMTKAMIDEITATMKAMEGKEVTPGTLIDINPGKAAAWYIAYST